MLSERGAFPQTHLRRRLLAVVVTLAALGPGCRGRSLAPEPEPAYIEMRTPAFPVPRGEEVQSNFFMKFPSDVPVLVNRLHLFMNKGSHHFNIYKSPADGPQYPEGQVEVGFSTRFFDSPWQLVVENQTGENDWTLPAGVAFR